MRVPATSNQPTSSTNCSEYLDLIFSSPVKSSVFYEYCMLRCAVICKRIHFCSFKRLSNGIGKSKHLIEMSG